MKRSARFSSLLVLGLTLGLTSPGGAAFPTTPVTKCASDAVKSGTVCLDKYEASVWRVPLATTLNASLVKKIQTGTATQADLTARGATQLGTASYNYAPCTDNGQACANDIYAVSLPAVIPSAYITWFQAQQACKNAGKRLPSNAEWQAAVVGTPDPGTDNGTTDCNTDLTFAVAATGSRSSCVSANGAFDMVGNLNEWVADWVPRSTDCAGWGAFSDDIMCLSGAATLALGPGALLRGGGFFEQEEAGSLAVSGGNEPSESDDEFGFRCAR